MQKSSESWEEVEVYEKLAFLLSAHMSVVEALSIMKYTETITYLKKGIALHQILKTKKIHTHIVSRISQGERTGTLAQACADIAQTLEKEREIKSKITLALLYPTILFLVTTGIVVFLVAYIFPKMLPLFMTSKTALPMTTRTVLWVSHSVIHFWWVYVIVIFTVVVFVLHKREFFLNHTPLVEDWFKAQKISQYFSRIGSYIDSGISLDIATTECAQVEPTIRYKAAFIHVAESIEQGISFSYVIEQHSLFPKDIAPMLIVGENSGRLGDMCKKIAEQYDRKFSNLTKKYTTAIEPLAMLCMGGVVGFVALSMITPLYSITQHVQ